MTNGRMKRFWHRGIVHFVLGFCLGTYLLAMGCSLPSLENRSVSVALIDTDTTRLGKTISLLVTEHPGKSGMYPLLDSRDAFAARILLTQAAERSLDVQYYIWRKDMSGTLLFEALRKAADRGVRIRLLLDDHNTSGMDKLLATLDAHPNIEVRLFNPFVIRNPRWIGFVTDFSRLNRRMHNKSFTVDNQVTIIGGRNIGDEYFGATDDVLFVDLDVIAIGPVVNEVSNDFDRYWASDSSYPIDRLLPTVNPVLLAELASDASLVERDAAAMAYVKALRDSPFVRELMERRLALEWVSIRTVSDNPAKGLGRAPPEALLPQKLHQIIGKPESSVDLVSPYFVPTAAGVDAFAALAGRGVKMRVLTNSLEATDVAIVHSGYAKRRKPLLDAGIVLYELQRISPAIKIKKSFGLAGSSGSSLHAKTFSVDCASIFIGSFNFDPRSANLNTELGFVIDSPALAQRIEATFDAIIPSVAYEVRLSETGSLLWIEHRQDEPIQHETEPGTSFLKRTWIWFMSILPIEWLL